MDSWTVDSAVWSWGIDFRHALISLTYFDALYSGDVTLVRQRYEIAKDVHSFRYPWWSASAGMLVKPSGPGGTAGLCVCPASWSPAGLPAGIYETLVSSKACACNEGVGGNADWPKSEADGYVNSERSAIGNGHFAVASLRMAGYAAWLGKAEEAAEWRNISSTAAASMRTHLWDPSLGAFRDGVGANHTAMHSTIIAAVAGAVDDSAVRGMSAAVVKFLRRKMLPDGPRCSCMYAFWVLEGLYRIGAEQAAGGAAADFALEFLTVRLSGRSV
jgi:hypothetical protein